MTVSDWIAIVGLIVTLIVETPVFLRRRGERKRRDEAGTEASGGGVSINQQITLSSRNSQATHNHFHEAANQAGTDPWALLAAYGAAIFAAALAYWLARPYLLVALVGIYIASVFLTWEGQHWTRPFNRRTEAASLAGAYGVVGANLLLLSFPGLPWGDGFRLGWTVAQAEHLHGLSFFVAAPSSLLITTVGLLVLTARALTVLANMFAARSMSRGRAEAWSWIASHLWLPGSQRPPLGTTALAGLIGLVVVGVGFPTLHAAHPSVHAATITHVR